jgi:hypothetical protein
MTSEALITATLIVGGGALAAHFVPPTLTALVAILGLWLGIGLVVGLIGFSVGLIWCTVLEPGALRAPTRFNERVEIPFSSITGVSAGSVEGLPRLAIKSNVLDFDLYIYTLGVDKSNIYMRLRVLAGPDNLLTKAFHPHGV